MNPKSTESKEEYRTQLCERVAFYRDNLFHGRTREMARYLDITHSVISKVTRGLQGPGEDFLNRLSGHPLVNTDWLLKGIGEPILPLTSGTLPVSESILPGAPVHHRELLTGERYPISNAQENHSRYWFRHGYDLPKLGIMAGDLLLIETDRNQLLRLDLIHHKLCAVSVPRGDSDLPPGMTPVTRLSVLLLSWLFCSPVGAERKQASRTASLPAPGLCSPVNCAA